MAVSIVTGGQYGSEGKGKTAFLWARDKDAAAAVRVGGSNSGHTVYGEDNIQYAFRRLPTASLLQGVTAVLPAGAYIDMPVLQKEIRISGISEGRLKVDPNAVIIKEEYKEFEAKNGMGAYIGSTLSGTGAAVAARAMRAKDRPVMRAQDVPELQPYLSDTKAYLRGLLDQGREVVIEGTQGYGLSNYHAEDYPCATSRDTTAAGFLAETGLSPFDVEHVILVIRGFPIRVAGHSGKLESEITWQIVSEESGAKELFEERTTVTDKVRRVGRFAGKIVREAIMVNRPDILVLNHVDYFDYANKNQGQLSSRQLECVRRIEEEIGQKIDFCGNGEMSLIPMRAANG